MPITAKQFIKKTTTAPEKFIDELFEFYEPETLQTDFVIKLDVVAKWLQANKRKLVETLKYSYKAGLDYVISKDPNQVKTDPRANNYKTYMLTPDCFKRLAMMSRSKNAELVRTYFIEVEGLYIRYRFHMLEGMQMDIQRLKTNQKPKGNFEKRRGHLYVMRVADAPLATDDKDKYNIGRARYDVLKRLDQYQVGRADDTELLYIYEADDIVGAEGCLKAYLKKYQYRKYKEVYATDLTIIKKFMKSCCDIGNAKLVSKKEKSELKGGSYYIFVDKK